MDVHFPPTINQLMSKFRSFWIGLQTSGDDPVWVPPIVGLFPTLPSNDDLFEDPKIIVCEEQIIESSSPNL